MKVSLVGFQALRRKMLMTHLKKSLALLLAIVMIFSSMSVAASAATFGEPDSGKESLTFTVKFFRNENRGKTDSEGNPLPASWVETTKAAPGEYVKARVYVSTNYATHGITSSLLFDSNYFDAIKASADVEELENPTSFPANVTGVTSSDTDQDNYVAIGAGEVTQTGSLSSKKTYRPDPTSYTPFSFLISEGFIDADLFKDKDLIYSNVSFTLSDFPKTVVLTDSGDNWYDEFYFTVKDSSLTRTVGSKGEAEIPGELRGSIDTYNAGVYSPVVDVQKGKLGASYFSTSIMGSSWEVKDEKFTTNEGWITTTGSILLDANGGEFADGAEIAAVEGIIESPIEDAVSEKEKEVSKPGYKVIGWSTLDVSKGDNISETILNKIGYRDMTDAEIAALGWKINDTNIGLLDSNKFPKVKAGDPLDAEMVAALDLGSKDATTLQFYGYNVTSNVLLALAVDEANTDFDHDGYTLYALWDNSGNAEYKVETYLMDVNGNYPSTPTQVDSFYAEAGSTVPLQAVAREGFTLDKNQNDEMKETPEKSSETIVVEADPENPSVLKAYYARNQYKLTYKYEDNTGEHVETELVYYGKDIPVFDSLPAENYELIITDDEGNSIATMPEKMPAKNINAFAFIQIIYLFDAGEGATFPNGERTMRYVYKFGEETITPANPSKPGYSFVDWDQDIPATATGDMTFNAEFNRDGSTEEDTFTVTFYNSKGEVIGFEDGLWYGYEYNAVDIPEGYLDTVWQLKGGDPVSFPYIITGDTEFEPISEEANVYIAYFYKAAGDSDLYATVPTAYGEAIVAPDDPSKTGHQFQGWSTDPNAEGPEALGVMDSTDGKTFYAVFVPNEVTLSFVTGEGATQIADITGKYDEKYNKPENPEKPGYEFKGWTDKDGKHADLPDTLPAESAEYTAEWSALSYNVIYKNGAELVGEVQKVKTDATVTVQDGSLVQKEGHTFAGWLNTVDGKIYNNPAVLVMPASDVTFEAQWTPNNYGVALDANGGAFDNGEDTFTAENIIYGTDLGDVVPADPEWPTDEKTFKGWAKADNATEEIVYGPGELQEATLTDNLNLKAVWDTPEYTATFYANGGYFLDENNNKVDKIEIPHAAGETITPPIPQRDDGEYNYTWKPSLPAGNVMPAADNEFFAQWEVIPVGNIKYTITPMIEVLKGDGTTEFIALAPIDKSGEEGKVVEITDDVAATSDIRHSYTNLIIDEGLVPDKENANNLLKITLTEGGDNNLVAYFVLKELTVVLDPMGGELSDSVVNPIEGYYGEKFILPTEKQIDKDSHKLIGWMDSHGKTELPGTELSLCENETYKAVWEEVTYSLTFDEDGGTPEVADKALAEGKTCVVPSLNKDGYRFNGWSDGENLYKPGDTFTMPAEAVTLTADFTKLYTATYLDAAGEVYDSGVAAENESVPVLTKSNPEKSGFRFGGWKNMPANGKMPASDIVLEPIFNELFTLSYVYDYSEEGFPELPASIELVAGEETVVKVLPSLEGYEFTGWTYDGTTYAPGSTFTMPANDAELVVTPNQIFSLTFDEAGGSKVSDAKLIAGEEYELPETFREGYEFLGWSDGIDVYPAGAMYAMPGDNIELEAKWKKIVTPTTARPTYTITFEIENGAPEGLTVPQAENVLAGDSCILPGLALEGYEFDYWYADGVRYPANYEYVATGDVTFVAKWTKVEEPSTETTTQPTEPATYTVKYALEDDSLADVTLPADKTAKAGEEVVLPGLPSKDGYEFDGWYNEKGVRFPAGYEYTVTGDVTLIAKWKELPTEPVTVPTTLATYTVKFALEDSLAGVTLPGDMTAKDGEEIKLPALPTKDGYDFDGWYDAKNIRYPAGADYTVKGNVTLTAKWSETPTEPETTVPTTTEAPEYTLSFAYGDGAPAGVSALPAAQQLKEGEAFKLPALGDVEGYTFKGWNTQADGEGASYPANFSFRMPGEATTLYAIYEAVVVEPTENTLSFDTDGGSAVADKKLLPGEVINLPKTSRTGFEFKGWKDSEGKIYDAGEAFTMPAGDETLTAIWEEIIPVEYNLSYAYIGELIPDNAPELPAAVQVKAGETVTVEAKPSVSGYKFSGWYYNGSIVDTFTMPSADVTLEGVWTVDLTEEKIYTVTYTFDGKAPSGAVVPGPKNVKAGETVTIAAVPSATGYTFDGWYYDGSIATSFTMPENDVTIVGKWVVNKNVIVLDANGGEFDDGSAQFIKDGVEYGTDLDEVLPNVPQKEGHTFVGWNTADGEDFTMPETMPDAPIDAVAEWKVNEYTITFDSNGGSEVPAKTYEYDAKVVEPAAPTREGFVFKGWEPALPEKMPAHDITVKAKWEAEPGVDTYEFTADANGGAFADGSTSITKELAEGEAIGELPTPTRDGYEFTGWEGLPEDGKMPASDLKITATWKEVVPTPESHKVNYYLVKGDGITEPYTTKTFEEGEALVHPTVEVEGFTFNGWTDADGKPLPETMGTEDIDAYANLEINSYKVTYLLDDGSVYEEYDDVKFASEVPVPADPAKEGYIFAGWDPAVVSTMPAHDLTYTAKWVKAPVPGEEYTARYVVDDKTYALYVLEEGDSIPVPAAPTKFGFVFVGWEPEVPATMPGENVEFVAQWEVDKTFIGLVVGGTVISGIVIGSVIGANAAWITGVSIVGGIIVIVGVAHLIKHTHTVTFMVDGEIYKVYKVVEGTKIPVPADPAKDGAEFAGWNPEVPEKMGNTDLVFEATWEDVGSDVDVVIPDTGSLAGVAAFAVISGAAAAAYVMAKKKKED